MSDASPNSGLEQVRTHLGRASGWFRFLGIMGVIGCGVMVVVALIISFAGFLFPFGMFRAPAVGLLIGAVYLALAVVLLFPSLMVLKLASGSRSFQADGAVSTLESVSLTAWKVARYCGVLVIVCLSVELLVLIFGLVFAMAGPRTMY